MGLLAKASVATDGAIQGGELARQQLHEKEKMERRPAQIEESVARYLSPT